MAWPVLAHVSRPSSDSRLKSSYLRQQHEQQQRGKRQQQQGQDRSSSSDGEEPARWHQTLERLRRQQQQQQHRPAEESEQEWVDAAEEDESLCDDRSGSHAPPQRLSAHPHKAGREGRHTPSPEQLQPPNHRSGRASPAAAYLGNRDPSGMSAAAASPGREQHCREPPALDSRRGSAHSSCTGSRASAATSATKAKFQAYPGQAALAYNPKAAANSVSYLHGEWGGLGGVMHCDL